MPLITIGQAPTTKINDYWCRDSIAESKVVELHKKSVLCDTALNRCVDAIDAKNLIIDNLLETLDKQKELSKSENDDIKERYEDKQERQRVRIFFSTLANFAFILILII